MFSSFFCDGLLAWLSAPVRMPLRRKQNQDRARIRCVRKYAATPSWDQSDSESSRGYSSRSANWREPGVRPTDYIIGKSKTAGILSLNRKSTVFELLRPGKPRLLAFDRVSGLDALI